MDDVRSPRSVSVLWAGVIVPVILSLSSSLSIIIISSNSVSSSGVAAMAVPAIINITVVRIIIVSACTRIVLPRSLIAGRGDDNKPGRTFTL